MSGPPGLLRMLLNVGQIKIVSIETMNTTSSYIVNHGCLYR